jgi:hypothetical protein
MIPFGGISSAYQLDTPVDHIYSLVADANYRVGSHLLLGGQFQYGAVDATSAASGVSGNDCGKDLECSGHLIRVGPQLTYQFSPMSSIEPWIGFGTGYEWLHLRASNSFGGATLDVRGISFATLRAGAAYGFSTWGSIGPYLSIDIGRYDYAAQRVWSGMAWTEMAQDISGRALHEWFSLGVRGTFAR